MTHVDEEGNIWIIPEPLGKCELCCAIAETRPYGPNKEEICFACGMKHLETTKSQIAERFGF